MVTSAIYVKKVVDKENKLKIIVIIVLIAAAIKLIIDSTGIF